MDALGPLGHPWSEPSRSADWRDDARCRSRQDVEFFGRSDNRHASAQAKRLCEACPVRSACLDYANENEIAYGIWGGMNVEERERLVGRKFPRVPTRAD